MQVNGEMSDHYNSNGHDGHDEGHHDGRKKPKELRNLHAPGDETSRFLEDFDPLKRRSAKTRKVLLRQDEVLKNNQSLLKSSKKVYDSKGVLLHNRRDMCDCLTEDCPGCHFPCPKCKSSKCGHECRRNRMWEYDSVEVDGEPSASRYNKFKAKPDEYYGY